MVLFAAMESVGSLPDPAGGAPVGGGFEVTQDDLKSLFRIKYGDPEKTGWGPRRRLKFGYYQPADYYEAVVRRCVTDGCAWLDIGGGSSPFPDNPKLAHELSQRAGLMVGVDPSANVLANPFLTECAQCLIEDYETDHRFDILTLRMVAEHVTQPERVVGALKRLTKPHAKVVVFTVNRRSPVTLASRITPFKLHHPVKKLFWGGEEEDTFPTAYRMNTRRTLKKQFADGGFEERYFTHVDDLSVFGGFKVLNYVELGAWRMFKSVGLRYPENCLLGVYQRTD